MLCVGTVTVKYSELWTLWEIRVSANINNFTPSDTPAVTSCVMSWLIYKSYIPRRYSCEIEMGIAISLPAMCVPLKFYSLIIIKFWLPQNFA